MWIFAFLGSGELLIIVLIILLLFGATRLPQLGDALGRGIRNFKDAISGKDEEDQKSVAIPVEKEEKKSLPPSTAEQNQPQATAQREGEKVESSK